MPPALLKKPRVTPDIQFYLSAFQFLSNFRKIGEGGASVILLADIFRYGEKVGYRDPNSLLFFAKVMSACDSVYVPDYNRRLNAKIASDRAMAAAKGKR